MTWDAQTYDETFGFVTEHGSVVLDLAKPEPGERILDLGCGTGHQTAQLSALGVAAVGVDVDAAMIARAREAHPDTPFLIGDAASLRPEGVLGDPFDAVVSNAALHWMPDQSAVLAAARALLRPGGRFVAEQGGVGNVARIWSSITAAHREVGLPSPVSPWCFPTPGEQAARLEAAGFRVRFVALVDRPTTLPDGSSAATWTTMFGHELIGGLDASTRATLLERIDVHAAAAGLHTPDGWVLDYVRLRFVAEAL